MNLEVFPLPHGGRNVFSNAVKRRQFAPTLPPPLCRRPCLEQYLKHAFCNLENAIIRYSRAEGVSRVQSEQADGL